jgi:N-acetylmuramoyl-L-alanine amidase
VEALRGEGFGLWWSDTTGVNVPASFDNIDALKVIGYDVRDTAATIQAFRRKFLQDEGSKTLSEADRKVLYTLYKQALR